MDYKFSSALRCAKNSREQSVILTGVNTVIDDDPTLNVRTEDFH
ncbi:MAG: hypothetical protein Ct9H300mP22_1960 [Gammaproteobacteria bacterium]|nr:MAG: hypothetical protein Ct9H300mP22_1960 [Gammaproteobacteria bacterium]